MHIVDPSSPLGQQMIADTAREHPTTQGDPPPEEKESEHMPDEITMDVAGLLDALHALTHDGDASSVKEGDEAELVVRRWTSALLATYKPAARDLAYETQREALKTIAELPLPVYTVQRDGKDERMVQLESAQYLRTLAKEALERQ